MPGANQYTTRIVRGYTVANDEIFRTMSRMVQPRYVDIGCNSGAFLLDNPGGVGLDASPVLVAEARAVGLDVVLGNAEALPFRSDSFQTAVLSCVLEQTECPLVCVQEALRVAHRVIGVNPIPGASVWGSVGGWVKSVIPESWVHAAGGTTGRMDAQRYWFSICR